METTFNFCLVNWNTETIHWFEYGFTFRREALIQSYFTGGKNAGKFVNVEFVNSCV